VCSYQKPTYADPYASEYKLSGGEELTELLKHPDFDLPSMCCQFDYWETFYREERGKREELERDREAGVGSAPRARTASQEAVQSIATERAPGSLSPPPSPPPGAGREQEQACGAQCLSCNGSGVMNPGAMAAVHDEGDCEDKTASASEATKVAAAAAVHEEKLADNTIIIAQQQQVRLMLISKCVLIKSNVHFTDGTVMLSTPAGD
jgi:hypothetical protein